MKNLELRKKWAELRAANEAVLAKLKTENRSDMTGEEIEQFEKRMADLNRIAKQIELTESHAEQEARDAGEKRENGNGNSEFRSFGHFIHEVRFNRAGMQERAMTMGTGEEGGFAVPDQFRSELLGISPEEAIVRPRATVIPAGEPPDAKITMPALDNTTNVFGGVVVTWIGEGAAKNSTDVDLKEVSIEPNEVSGYVTISDKLLRNWKASGPLVGRLLRGAISASEDYKFLRGNGSGCPQGVTSAGCKLTVNRGTGSHVTYVDAASMIARMLPESLGRAVWVANMSTMPDILQLKTADNAPVFIQSDATKAMPSTLLGLPLLFTGRTPVLGVQGDLMLCDFKYYLIKDGSGPFVAASEHVNFVNNKTVIKAFWNVDGKAWPAAVVTLEDAATTASPFVVLN